MNIPKPNEFAQEGGFKPFPPKWERWLSSVREAIIAAQPTAGRNVTTDVHPGQGTVVNAPDRKRVAGDCGGCVCIDTAEINAAGSGYRIAERLVPGLGTVCPTGGGAFQLLVTGIDGSGAVTDFVIIPGAGYSEPPSNPIFFGGSTLGSGFTANCTFACTSGTKPSPTPVDIEFHDVIFDCGCIDGGSGTSRTVEEGNFNSNPITWTKVASCGGTALWSFGTCTSGIYPTLDTFWDNSDCSGDPSSGPSLSEKCNVIFFLRDNVYRLIALDGWRGPSNQQLIFDGTTTDLSLPIANTVSGCDPAIAHGGTATVT